MPKVQREPSIAGRPMWCDDFDAELYKVLPEAREILAPVRDVVLYTHGNETSGALNLPTCWERHGEAEVFFGFWGPAKPAHCVTDKPVIRCTFEEAIRDLWVHGCVMLVERVGIWNSQRQQVRFDLLMYHLRGQQVLDEEALAGVKRGVMRNLVFAVDQLQRTIAAVERDS